MIQRIIRFIPALLWMALIYQASATPGLKSVPLVQRAGLLPASLSPGVAHWLELILRKSAHLGSYAVLGLLLAWALTGLLERRRAIWVAFAVAVLYAVGDEWHQSFVPDRSGRWYDVLIDGVGAGLGLLLWGWRGRRSA